MKLEFVVFEMEMLAFESEVIKNIFCLCNGCEHGIFLLKHALSNPLLLGIFVPN